MTFDDGIVGVYKLTQTKVPGKMPVEGLEETERFYFSYDNIGITRYYTALQANQIVDSVICVPGWHEIKANRHIAIIADADGMIDETTTQYRIIMVQPTHDDFGLRITRLSLERIGDGYAVFTSTGC